MSVNSKFQNYMSSNPEPQVNLPEKPKEPEMVEVDREDFMTKAKILVAHDFNDTFFPNSDNKATPKEFYVVIFAKELQNWKALISTDIVSGQYWEVTYDGDKKQTYVDHYVKRQNTCITDEHYARLS